MPVPTDRWLDGSWNPKLTQFHRLAEMLGGNTFPVTPQDLQGLFSRVATAKVFADNVQPFIEASTGFKGTAADYIENIERKLGTMDPVPFRSLEGLVAPPDFNGVAIWPTGTANWTKLRLEQIETAVLAGANIKHIVCTWSTRVCGGKMDRLHPLLAGVPVGEEPTEQLIQRQLAASSKLDDSMFRFAELPESVPIDDDKSRPLSLEEQLNHLMASDQYDELIGDADIYVPATPNSLYVPLHVRRVLGRDNVWLSQAGAHTVRVMPEYWWPTNQDIMTLPNGWIRLWVELLFAGCLTD